MECTFNIPGEPVGKGRPRFRVFKGRVMTYTPPKTAKYEKLVKKCFLDQVSEWVPDDKECRVVIVAEFSIPKSTPKKKLFAFIQHLINPTKKPDVDNIAKIVMDAINGVAYKDDSFVTSLFVKKIYSDDPKVTVTLCKKE